MRLRRDVDVAKRTATATFFFLFVFLAVVAIVYGLLSDDRPGTVLLLLASGVVAIAGAYLAITPPVLADEDDGRQAEEPVAGDGWWPLAVGVGSVGLLTGAVVGAWTALPGVALVVLGVARWLRAD
jgi:hypothetical protein